MGNNKRVFKVREVIKVLVLCGWVMAPQMRGDHRQFHREGNPYVITVAGHLDDEVPLGIVKRIERIAELRFRDFFGKKHR